MVFNYFDGSTFEDLEEAMNHMYIIMPDYVLIDDSFDFSVEWKIETKAYAGKYIRKVKYGENDIGTYEFAYCGYSVETHEETKRKYLKLVLVPTYFSDDRIVELIGAYDGCFYEDILIEKGIEDLWWEVIWSCDDEHSIKNDIKKDELFTFEGTIRKIKKDDLYVQYEGVNYQILEEPRDENGNPYIGTSFSKDEFETAEASWEEIEEDNFMGKIVQEGVNNIGTLFEETYTIDSVEDDVLYCIDEEHAPIFSRNLPQLLAYENGECGFCARLVNLRYIPYSLDESL